MSPIVAHKVFWYYRQANQSPLVTPEFLARARAIKLPGQYAQEHENTVMDAADSFASVADVEAAMGSGWTEQAEGQSGRVYTYGVDLGSVHDPTVIGVGHAEAGVICLDKLITLQGSRDNPVLIPVVKQTILDLVQQFPPATPQGLRIESWQGLQVTQELTGLGLPVQLFAATAKAHAEEWPVLAQRLSSRTLVLFPHARLREELLNLTYEVGPSGVRVIDKGRIHQDHAVALRLVVAGLSGPVRAPWTFFSEGRHFGAAVPTSAPEPQPASPRQRSIEQIEQLDEGVRSPEEQARLDAHYAARAAAHVETPLEAALRRGDYFPGRPDSLPESADPMERVRQTFQRWRERWRERKSPNP